MVTVSEVDETAGRFEEEWLGFAVVDAVVREGLEDGSEVGTEVGESDNDRVYLDAS